MDSNHFFDFSKETRELSKLGRMNAYGQNLDFTCFSPIEWQSVIENDSPLEKIEKLEHSGSTNLQTSPSLEKSAPSKKKSLDWSKLSPEEKLKIFEEKIKDQITFQVTEIRNFKQQHILASQNDEQEDLSSSGGSETDIQQSTKILDGFLASPNFSYSNLLPFSNKTYKKAEKKILTQKIKKSLSTMPHKTQTKKLSKILENSLRENRKFFKGCKYLEGAYKKIFKRSRRVEKLGETCE